MECPNCGMTSFRSPKKCANCNTDLTRVSQRRVADIFSIYQSPVGAGIFEQLAEDVAANHRFVKTLEYPEVAAPVSDFDLDLSDTETLFEKQPTASSMAKDSVATETTVALDSETVGEDEIEVEGLGFEFTEPSTVSELDEKSALDDSKLDLEPESVSINEPEQEDLESSLSLDFDTTEDAEISLEIEEPSISATIEEEEVMISEVEPSISLDLESEHQVELVDPRLAIEDLDLGEEPKQHIETVDDPRLAIEDLDLTLEIEESLPEESTVPPEASLDGIKLEIEEHPSKDLPPPEN